MPHRTAYAREFPWVKKNFRHAQNRPCPVFTSLLNALRTLPLNILSKHEVSGSLTHNPGRLRRSWRFYRFIFFPFHRLWGRNSNFSYCFVVHCARCLLFGISKRTSLGILKANRVLESIVVRLKAIFIFLTRAQDTLEEWNISTDVMYSKQFESTASAQCTS